jgi:hypothetical protein
VRLDLRVHGVGRQVEISGPPHGPEFDRRLGEALRIGQA